MSVATEIARIKQATNDLKDVIASKGVDIPEGTKIDAIPDIVDTNLSAGGGGGGDISDYFNDTITTNTTQSYGAQRLIKLIPSTINVASNVKNLEYAFYNFRNLDQTIFINNTSQVTNMSNMFEECAKLTEIQISDTSNVTNMGNMFYRCTALTTAPNLNTSKVTNMSYMFYGCNGLITIPEYDCSSCTNINYMFGSGMSNTVTTVGGFKDLGKAYSPSQSAGYSYYALRLSLGSQTQITEQSLINILNDLYDIASLGCNPQNVVIGSWGLAKLTSPEGQQALANAQAKGWNIS